jgi:two-component system cell cycle sensor histidine kinase/response regulator CckA
LPGAQDEAYACLSVSDTGVGMDEQIRGKIFEPFFSTKERTKGTGLGLAVVYGIVNSHHGFVDVASQPGQGSTFRLYFPIPTSSTAPIVHDEPRANEASGGNETILVAEDEEALRDLVQALLESKGYTILTASDGEQAVVLFEEHRDGIDLVLTDLGLPKLDGWSACKQMIALKPHVKVIIASGYLDPEMKQEMVARNSIIEFVHKPYLPTELMSTVRSLLDRTQALEA